MQFTSKSGHEISRFWLVKTTGQRRIQNVRRRVYGRGKPEPLSCVALAELETLWNEYFKAQKLKGYSSVLGALQRLELIGCRMKVIQSSNPSELLIEGVLLDESYHCLFIQSSAERVVQVAKKGLSVEMVGVIFLCESLEGRRVKSKIRVLRSTFVDRQ